LPRFYAHRLREHVNRNRFASGLKLTITAKAEKIFQESLPELRRQVAGNKYCLPASAARKYAERFPAGANLAAGQNQAVL